MSDEIDFDSTEESAEWKSISEDNEEGYSNITIDETKI